MLATLTTTARDRRGRARTGPSASRFSAAGPLVACLVFVLALAAAFAFGTEARRALSPEAFGVTAGLASALGIAIVSGRAKRVISFDARRSLVAFALGGVALTGAPYVVMLNRYSDAPPGSEVLFLTTAAWGALLALGLVFTRRGVVARLALVAGAALGLAGVVGIVANWERPSSFSLFFRYVSEESWMLAAGVAVALLWWWLDRERERGALNAAALAAAAGALAAAIALGLARAGQLGLAAAVGHQGLLLYALATASAVAAAVVLLRAVGAQGIAAALFLPPAVLTLLTYIEQATKIFGPQPILLGPAAAGSVTALAAAVLIARAPSARGPASGGRPDRRAVAAVVLSAASALAAMASLALPALGARVIGLRTSGATLDLRFTLIGAETVGSWLVLALALGTLAASIGAVRMVPRPGDPSRGRVLATIVALGAAAAAWPFVRATPLRTLTSFVPSEVQVDFGSEFASITFSSLAVPAAVVAVCGTALALGVLLVCVIRARGPIGPGAPESEGDLS